MTLEQLRDMRATLKQAIERKHNDWFELACNNEMEAAEVAHNTIEKLYALLEQTDKDIIETKERLIREAV